jgi:hypothetical protein
MSAEADDKLHIARAADMRHRSAQRSIGGTAMATNHKLFSTPATTMWKRIALAAVVAMTLGAICTPAHAGTVTNGLRTNGLNANGLNANGLNANGLSANGLSANGLSANGLSANGLNGNGVSTIALPDASSFTVR